MAKQIGRYTAEEVAACLKISRATFYRWKKKGKISIRKIDGFYMANDVFKAIMKLQTS